MKRKLNIYKAAGIAAGLILSAALVIGIAGLSMLNEIKTVLDNEGMLSGSVSYTPGYEEYPEVPSIFYASDLKPAGRDTLNVEKGTMDYNISLTPYEFTESTKAKIKAGGKTYKLKRQDNSFTGTFPASVFEAVEPEVILEDDSTIRTEAPLCENALRDTSWGWIAAGSSSPTGGNLKFDLLVRIGTDEVGEDVPDRIQMIAAVDGKTRFKKEKQIETWTEPDIGEDVTGFLFQEKIPLKEGETLELYVERSDQYGFVYRYKLGEAKAESRAWDNETDEQILEVFSPKGKLLLQKNLNSEEE